ncbi:PAS domain S-box protein [Vibrio sp. PP-XX7]
MGKPFVDLVIPEQYQEEDSYILEHIRRGESIPYLETVRQRKDGSLVDVAVTVSPIYSDDKIVIGVSKTVRDISVQKAAEVQIHELNANLEKQVQERTTELLLARDQLISTTDQLLMAAEVAELGIWTWSWRMTHYSGMTKCMRYMNSQGLCANKV